MPWKESKVRMMPIKEEVILSEGTAVMPKSQKEKMEDEELRDDIK